MYNKISLSPQDSFVQNLLAELDELDNAHQPAILQAIYEAIMFYRYEPFYFNYSCNIELPLIKAVYQYGVLQAADPRLQPWEALYDIFSIHKIRLKIDDDKNPEFRNLTLVNHDLSKEAAVSSGIPEFYSYKNSILTISPAPEQDYSVFIDTTPAFFTSIDANNIWLKYAPNLIKYRAKHLICRNLLDWPQAASLALIASQEEYRSLLTFSSRQANTSTLSSTEF